MGRWNNGSVKVVNNQGPMGWVLFVAYFGAAVYFYEQNPGFEGFILAVLKAIVWPGYLIYHVFQALGV